SGFGVSKHRSQQGLDPYKQTLNPPSTHKTAKGHKIWNVLFLIGTFVVHARVLRSIASERPVLLREAVDCLTLGQLS
ncbi:hypothetical protein, partial [Candidatus Poriferisodalis multihospitum]|uniref:hypothetical protein n=1 Tax=Candidatus Poriferisodalis multihospitum TaxID=2983191 RepID=UPI002B263B71